jgi:hypothetical protein
MMRSLSIVLMSVALYGASPVAASAQQTEAPVPEVLCDVNRERAFARYPGLDSSPSGAVSQWGVAHLRQALLGRGCTGFVRDGRPAIDVTDHFLSRLDSDHASAFAITKPLFERAERPEIVGVVEQVGPCEINVRYVYASRPELPLADGRVYVTRLDQITSIRLYDSGKGFAVFGGRAGRDYQDYAFETEAEARTYANAFAALAAPCMRRASAS